MWFVIFVYDQVSTWWPKGRTVLVEALKGRHCSQGQLLYQANIGATRCIGAFIARDWLVWLICWLVFRLQKLVFFFWLPELQPLLAHFWFLKPHLGSELRTLESTHKNIQLCLNVYSNGCAFVMVIQCNRKCIDHLNRLLKKSNATQRTSYLLFWEIGDLPK